MTDVSCIRCGQTREGIAAPPFPTDFGAKIHATICAVCWKDWLRQQTQVINHYSMDLRDPKTRQTLLQQTETFLFAKPVG